MYLSVAGIPASQLTGPGKDFVTKFESDNHLTSIEPYTAYAAQAAEVMIQAISNSDGTRQSVTDNLFKTKITDGILGTFAINRNGDTTSNPVTIDIAHNGALQTFKVITPQPSLVAAA